MRVGVIDVIDWQTVVDLSDARPVDASGPLVELARDVVRTHPYPGDLDPGAVSWVTDVALDLNRRYQPDFMTLVYANPFFGSVFRPTSETDRANLIDQVFEDIDRFVEGSGFTPVLVGLGDLIPCMGFIDLTTLDGLGVGDRASPHGGLHGGSASDLATLAKLPGVARIVSRESFRREFGGRDSFYSRFPDHLLIASEGYYFRGIGSNARPIYRTLKQDREIPVASSLGRVPSLTSIPELVLDALAEQKVALVLIEGVGCETFPRPYERAGNTCHWYAYPLSEAQYLAITTGRHLTDGDYPPGYLYYLEDAEDRPYPLSGVYTEMPTGTIAQRSRKRSATVGNRGMWTHVTCGADIVVECFSRVLYNHGVMAVAELAES